MSGKITFLPTPEDDCIRGWGCADKPNANEYPATTQWTCDNCDQVWVVVEGAQYNETWRAWRKLTPQNIEGHDR